MHLCYNKSEGKDLCAFCRTPHSSSYEEEIERINKLIDKGNGEAYYSLAGCYSQGLYDTPQDSHKACQLWLKAGELGCADAYRNVGVYYHEGVGVERDINKAMYYYERAAMGGSVQARYYLGREDYRTGKQPRALKHFVLAARAGYKDSLEIVKKLFMHGVVAKDEYATILRAYQESQDGMKSDARDKVVLLRRMGAWHLTS